MGEFDYAEIVAMWKNAEGLYIVAMQDAPCLLVDMGRAGTGIFVKPGKRTIDITGYENQLKDIPWAYMYVLSSVVPGVPGGGLRWALTANRDAGDSLPPLPDQDKESLSDIFARQRKQWQEQKKMLYAMLAVLGFSVGLLLGALLRSYALS